MCGMSESAYWTPTLGFNAMFQWLSLDPRRLSLLRFESVFTAAEEVTVMAYQVIYYKG